MAPGPLQGLSVIAESGEEFDIFRGSINLLHLDGVGLPPIERRLVRSPLMHGAKDKGFRLLPRSMTLTVSLRADSLGQSDGLRDHLAYIFAPTNSLLTLKATRDDFTVRYIDCFVRDEIDFPQSQRIGTGQTVVIPLTAPDPVWYDTTVQTVTQVLTNGGANNFQCVVTGMSWDDWPVINITGPLNTGLSIVHTPANETISLDDAIPGGETISIDLRPAYKTVRRVSDNANKFSYINPNSLPAFSQFRIMSPKNMKVADPVWTNNYNNIAFSGVAGATGATSATISWYKRYISL
jgi:Phage tail protein